MSARFLPPLFLAALILLAPAAAGAADAAPSTEAASAIEAVWSRFTDSLRRGDYPTAHAQFSAESRRALPYGEFVEEYSPLSPARELVLAPAERATARHEENWAELFFEGAMPATGRAFRVGVSLVRNGNAWGVVAARNEQAERIEALVRRALARLAGVSATDFAARAAQAAAGEPALQLYRLRLEGGVVVAEPATAELRAFHLGADGVVGEGRAPAPQTSRQQRQPIPATSVAGSPDPARAAPAQPGALPELSEPPPPRQLPPMPAEPAEPPPSGGGSLPEQIGG